jgi:hypothetical protein
MSRILQSQKNEVFALIKSAGLDPSDFQWADAESHWTYITSMVSRLKHKHSSYFFQFDFYLGEHRGFFSPGRDSEFSSGIRSLSFEDIFNNVKTWLYYLKREINAPDLWGALLKEKELAEIASASEDQESFSAEEQRQISEQLRELREYLVKTYNLTEAQSDRIERRLNYLEDALGRMNKKDWLTLSMGVLFCIAASNDLTREAISEMYAFFGQAIVNAIMNIGPLALP